MKRFIAGAALAAALAVVAACGGQGQDAKAAPTAATTAAAAGAAGAEPASAEADLFAFAAGARFVAKPDDIEYASVAYGPYNLLDETPATDVRVEAGKPAVFVLELAERTELSRIGFDSAGLNDEDKTPKAVKVEVSDVSATDGFKEVLATDLKRSANDQNFDLAGKPVGRWVRLTLISNYGADNYGLTGFRGYGRQLTNTATMADVSGTYGGASGWGTVRLKQEGTRVTGCYDYLDGVVSGGVEGRLLKLTMVEQNPAEVSTQLGLFSFSADGKAMFGLTRRSDALPEWGWSAYYSAEKVSDDIGDCPRIPGWKGAAAKGQLTTALETEGRARLDGVNFDFNSDKLQAASLPLLDQVAAMLAANPGWKVTLEGHTDNIGGEAFNKTLSTKRAEAVKAYLVSKGIDAGRLTAAGFGYDKPVGSNDTQAGRAQNRRVEIVKR